MRWAICIIITKWSLRRHIAYSIGQTCSCQPRALVSEAPSRSMMLSHKLFINLKIQHDDVHDVSLEYPARSTRSHTTQTVLDLRNRPRYCLVKTSEDCSSTSPLLFTNVSRIDSTRTPTHSSSVIFEVDLTRIECLS